MKVRDLRLLMAQLLATSHSLPTADAREVQRFLGELGAFDDCNLDELGLTRKKLPRKVASEAKGNAGATTAELVEAYVSQLHSASNDPVALDKLVDALLADRALKAQDITQIANRFRGSRASYKSKADAVNAIRSKAISDRRSSAQRQRIRDIF